MCINDGPQNGMTLPSPVLHLAAGSSINAPKRIDLHVRRFLSRPLTLKSLIIRYPLSMPVVVFLTLLGLTSVFF